MSLKGWKYVPGKPDKRSPAQKAAHTRSFQIFQLRGLHALCHRLTEPRRSVVQFIIDEELSMLGAETQFMRDVRRRAGEIDALVGEICDAALEITAAEVFGEIPF